MLIIKSFLYQNLVFCAYGNSANNSNSAEYCSIHTNIILHIQKLHIHKRPNKRDTTRKPCGKPSRRQNNRNKRDKKQ